MSHTVANGTRQAQEMPQITLRQINETLAEAGFPSIDGQQMNMMKNFESRNRIIKAINIARDDTGARAFLTTLFGKCGIQVGTSQASQQNGSARSQAPREAASSPAQNSNSYQHASNAPAMHTPMPESRSSSTSSQAETARVAPEDRFSFHVYGGKAALSFEADMTRNDAYTIALDAASTTGPRTYDWKNKIRIQLTRAELPVVAAVLVGARAKCEFKNHGPENNKGFSMERQGEKVFIKVFGSNVPVKAVPVEAPDVFYVTTLVIRQLRKNAPWLDPTSITNLLFSTLGTASQ